MTDVPPPDNPYAPVAAQPMSPADERLWSMLTHIGAMAAILIGLPWLVPLITYLVLRDRGPFVRAHTATELNFQLTLLIGYVAGFVLSIVFVGFLLLIALPIIAIVFGIIASIAANRGQYYTYPVAIRFVQ